MDDLPTFGEKLKCIRLHKGWTQDVMAEKLGIPRSSCSRLEANQMKLTKKESLVKLVEVSGAEPETLFDDYTYFLYCGQEKMLKAHRRKLRLNKKQLARRLRVREENIRDWESGKKQMSRESWERVFEEKKE